jgi:hypothetical protein
MTTQLSLKFDVDVNKPIPDWTKFRTQEQEEWFQGFLANLRQETSEWMQIANEVLPIKYQQLHQVSTKAS